MYGGIEIYMDGQDLCIKDTGIGIKNSDVLRVFERGFSGYNGRMTQQHLDLALSNPENQPRIRTSDSNRIRTWARNNGED